MAKLDGKVALVTGGTTGIGRAAALRFQQEGATVIVTGRNPRTVAEARETLPGIEVMQSDVSDIPATRKLFADIKARHGKLDVLFANAGIAQFIPADAVDEAFFDALFGVNVRGAFFTLQQAAAIMADGGSIIINSSAAGQKGMAGATVYAATKAAVRSFGRTFAAELAPRRIRVNTISPGPIETPIFDKMEMPDDQKHAVGEMLRDMVPLKRFGSADDVAEAALFLAVDGSAFVTGIDLPVDGGITGI
jgi:NAD(P)-dependent dehydrogenase (short-subunit alcohol dehydrogenase family)